MYITQKEAKQLLESPVLKDFAEGKEVLWCKEEIEYNSFPSHLEDWAAVKSINLDHLLKHPEEYRAKKSGAAKESEVCKFRVGDKVQSIKSNSIYFIKRINDNLVYFEDEWFTSIHNVNKNYILYQPANCPFKVGDKLRHKTNFSHINIIGSFKNKGVHYGKREVYYTNDGFNFVNGLEKAYELYQPVGCEFKIGDTVASYAGFKYTIKSFYDGICYFEDGSYTGIDELNKSFKLYKKLTPIPFGPTDIKPGAVIKNKNWNENLWSMVLKVWSEGIIVSCVEDSDHKSDSEHIGWEELQKSYIISFDGGKTWKGCHKE